MSTSSYFLPFRQNIIGIDQTFVSPCGKVLPIVYADWTASGRMYGPIEKRMRDEILPFVANTHTEANATGTAMTHAYHKAREVIRQHVNAADDDVLIMAGSGMTGAVNKLQRLLGMRIHEKYSGMIHLHEDERPVVFITHMEHHSNQTSWLETIAEVVIIPPTESGLVNPDALCEILPKYASRKLKIAAITACSNVTGIITPYPEIARLIHAAGGYCFVDFACSAPYVNMNMHPAAEGEHLDAIYFSPHKFLGGPGTSGVLIFNKKLYQNHVPDHPGGGTVTWTNPWGTRLYHDSIEEREDGGTPAFLQTIRAALCIKLKEEMGTENILAREHELVDFFWNKLGRIPNLHFLAPEQSNRLGVLSFYINGLNFNHGVKLLNDKFGIQVRGGCACAATYGHFLFGVSRQQSDSIMDMVNHGDYSQKPGWIRLSLHPTMTDEEAAYIATSIEQLALNFEQWLSEYAIDLPHQRIAPLTQAKGADIGERMEELLSLPLV
ncbi:MAG: aminotransferase class V-fold PLP-dependent enzyme [Bacteroidia bacterium]|nr:aminotransferase class V-fold PLP-dependent enzyme [Bacteroidia bacterium]